MRFPTGVKLLAAAMAVMTCAPPIRIEAAASTKLSGSITVWSWNIAAEALDNLVPDFNRYYPDIKVRVIKMGHSDVRDRALAACAAGGFGMPDVITIENQAAEQFWQKFPNCFRDLSSLGYPRVRSGFARSQQIGLSVGPRCTPCHGTPALQVCFTGATSSAWRASILERCKPGTPSSSRAND